MEECIFQINENPTKLTDINKQVVANYQLLQSWLQYFYEQMRYINNPLTIIQFLQITQEIFELQNSSREQGAQLVQLFCQIVKQIIMNYPELRSNILKSLLISAQETNVSHKDIYMVLNVVTNSIPSTKVDLLNLLDQVYQELGLQLNLSSIIVDDQYLNQIISEKNLIPNVFDKIIRLTQFAELLSNLNGTIVNLIQLLFNFCLQCDTFYQILNNILQKNSTYYDLQSIQNESQILEEISQFIRTAQQLQSQSAQEQFTDEQQEQKLQDIKLNEILEIFLVNHPQVTYYIKEQYVKVIDNIMLSVLNLLVRSQNEIIINVFLPLYFEKVLGGSTVYTHYLIFPLLKDQQLKQQILNKLVQTGFCDPGIQFDMAQNAQLFLISMIINSRYFSDEMIIQIISYLFLFRDELERQLKENHNERKIQYYIQISRCIMVISIILFQQVPMQELKKQFTNLASTLQGYHNLGADTIALLNDFIKLLSSHKLIEAEINQEDTQYNYQQNNILNQTLVLFGQTNLVLCAEKYLDGCYRYVSDTDLI